MNQIINGLRAALRAAFLFAASILCAVLTVTSPIKAQSFGGNTTTTPLNAYAITNARLITVSGAIIERGTIVVRDGLISEIGANVRVPADVRTIDGTGLTVYPGFIDANTNLGLTAPAPRPSPGAPGGNQFQPPPQNVNASNSRYPSGLQPDIAAAELVRPSDSAFETARNNGVTAALVVPRDGIFLGQSALINLAGETAATSIIRAPVAQHVVTRTLSGNTFPNSLLGTYAALRQLMLDARRLQTINQTYARDPRGLKRPEADRSLEALFPVLNRQIPLVIQADTEREIVRALDLAAEFNVNLIVAGGVESHKVAARLARQNVPVLLSLNFPRRTTAASAEADPEPLRVLRQRAEAPLTAARLQQARVRFAFQSGGATNPADYLNNAAKAIENGLSITDATRAMTLGAAEILGVNNQLGSLETGKIANLTVTRGDAFGKTRTITHVFVDGRMFEIKQLPAPNTNRPAGGAPTPGQPATTANAVNLTGIWTLNAELAGQPYTLTATFDQQGTVLTGTLATPGGSTQITAGEVTNDAFRFTSVVTFGQTFDVVFNGRVNGNQISGTATTPQGAVPFTGTKTP